MISIDASTLHRMLQQVTPHMLDADEHLPVICSVRLEARDGWLYAAATDRYTYAISRREIVTSSNHLVGHLPGHYVPAVMSWLNAAATNGHTVGLTLPITKDAPVTFTSPSDHQLNVGYDADDYAKFPDWRPLFRAALTAEPNAIPLTGFTTKFLPRWQHAAAKLVTWQAGGDKPLLLLDELGYFIGMQMPVGFAKNGMRRKDVATGWLAATARTATVDGLTYDLDKTWLDAHGDPWTYSGKDADNVPLMVMDGIEEDPHPLDQLITQYGPLYAA